jgi:hypothetical protein
MARLNLADSMGLVVDVQERVVAHLAGREAFVAAVVRLVQGLQILEVPLRWVQEYTKGLGETVEPLRSLLAGSPRHEKLAFSCCREPAILADLRGVGRGTVIVAGSESHVCVLQTCLDLLAAGFTVAVPEDAVGSRRPDDRRVALERLRQEGARITTVESLLFELLGGAGTDVFRRISRLVK